MKQIYAKAALYMYATIPRRIKELDNIIYKKALESRLDRRSAIEIAEDIIESQRIKANLLELHSVIAKIISTLPNNYIDCIYYKYCRKLKHTYSETFDPSSRQYFRRQHRVISQVAEKLIRPDLMMNGSCLLVTIRLLGPRLIRRYTLSRII